MLSKMSQDAQENTCARVSRVSVRINFIKETLAQVFSCEFCEKSLSYGTRLVQSGTVLSLTRPFHAIALFLYSPLENQRFAEFFYG